VDRVKALRQSAAVLGWVPVGEDWRCPGCYRSARRDAELRQRTGDHQPMAALDRAVGKRDEWRAVRR
jgi:hypothetical protein